MNPKQISTWLTRALPRKTDYRAKDYMRAPFAVNGIAYVTDGVRAHIGENVPAEPAGEKAVNAANELSKMLLKARKGYRVTLPASVLREVSDVMGKEDKKRDRANLLKITLSSDSVQFERPGVEMETRATVSKADGYKLDSFEPLPPLPDEGMALAVNPGFLHDAVSIVPVTNRKRKGKQKQTTADDTVTISIAAPLQPIAIDYNKLTAIIQPMTIGA